MWFQLHEVVACVECIIIEVVHRRLYRAWEYIDSILMLVPGESSSQIIIKFYVE